MILLSAIANITSNLDIICKQDGKGIASHSKLKEEALECLSNLIDKAPINEIKNMLSSKDCDILIGYLMSVLCHMSKSEKSRDVRLQSLKVIHLFINRLGTHHRGNYSRDKCAIRALIVGLPGISSTLFRIMLSDTKLRCEILVESTQALSSLLEVCFQTCNHTTSETSESNQSLIDRLEGTNLEKACDNLALRIDIMIAYIMNNAPDLAPEFKKKISNLIQNMITNTHPCLIKKITLSVIKYVSHLISECHSNLGSDPTVDAIMNSMQSQLDLTDSDLIMSILDRLSRSLDNLENNLTNMLYSERRSQLAIILGTITMLPNLTVTSFMEIPHRRQQFWSTFAKLTEFSNQQPLLFLTDNQVDETALELSGKRSYTFEKRFKHLVDEEVSLVRETCRLIGKKVEWNIIRDLIHENVVDFSDASKLYLVCHLMEGIQQRQVENLTSGQTFKFTKQTIDSYIVKIDAETLAIYEGLDETFTTDILKTIVAIESVAELVAIHTKFIDDPALRIIILKDLLCPLLNWSSSPSRIVSEAALNTLLKVSQFYGHTSIHDLIYSYIDYLVDGISKMLDNFIMHPEVTNVLAIALKLASMDIMFYFKDIYERIFRLLNAFHYTDRSRSISLLFYRTLTIISEWTSEAQGDHHSMMREVPLENENSIKSVIDSIDIRLRLRKLRDDRNRLRLINEPGVKENLQSIRDDIEGAHDEGVETETQNRADDEKEKKQTEEIIMTEKILKHCIGLLSSKYDETKILAMKTVIQGFKILKDDENILLPLVHQLWSPLVCRLTGDYNQNLEINLCAFECLVTMAFYSGDFIKKRTLDTIIPRVCVFLGSQLGYSKGQKEYSPYCMTMAYKCQLKLLTHLGPLTKHINLAYYNLWRVIKVSLAYLDDLQVPSLREAARVSLHYMIALDADCVWYYAKQANMLDKLPFEFIFETTATATTTR